MFQTGNQSNSGMYYQTMSGYPQQASPYAMQPTVSQGNLILNLEFEFIRIIKCNVLFFAIFRQYYGESVWR